MVVTVKGLDQQNQPIRLLKKPATMVEKEKMKGMPRLQKEVQGIQQIHLQRRRKLKKYNEGYYTDNINSDSLHQESDYQDITDDDIYEKSKKKKPNKKEDWSDKALEDFLETLREQPVREMNDRRNKWIMFSKCLEKKGTKKRNDECRKQVFTINSLVDVKGTMRDVPLIGGNV